MSESTSRPSFRALMCSIAGSLASAEVDMAGHPSHFGSKLQLTGFKERIGLEVKYWMHGAGPRTVTRGRPGPGASGRDRDRPDPARVAPAPGGPGSPLRREPDARARGAAPAPGHRARRAARPSRRARAPVLGGGV